MILFYSFQKNIPTSMRRPNVNSYFDLFKLKDKLVCKFDEDWIIVHCCNQVKTKRGRKRRRSHDEFNWQSGGVQHRVSYLQTRFFYSTLWQRCFSRQLQSNNAEMSEENSCPIPSTPACLAAPLSLSLINHGKWPNTHCNIQLQKIIS